VTGGTAPPARVVLLAGPSGSGKTHLADESGLPVLDLDHFYRDGDDPALPRRAGLDIVDWDDPRSWDADAALGAIEALCGTGCAEVPIYRIGADRRVGHRTLELAGARAFVATGIFAAELVPSCRYRGLLADAVVLRRAAWKNFLRRLVRDLREHRKPPMTLVRRGLALMHDERRVVEHALAAGCRPCDRASTLAALRAAAARTG
jgi:uridine kinase